ncbi:MAG: phosphatidylserine/phosphatidylglycerophosphate/cardiolipin synthase family protein [Myxococcaceae bacterium]
MPSIQPLVRAVPIAAPVVAASVSKDVETKELPFELPDFDINTLDLNMIQKGTLRMSVPLREGVYLLPGKYQKANVVVKANTMAWLTVTLGRNPNNQTVMTRTSIQISPAIKITNPSSAYEPADGFNGFKDLFADVKISGIEIDPEGKVQFQGILKKGFSSVDIKNAFKPDMFPIVDLKLETLKKKQIDTSKIGLPDLMKQFSGLLGQIKCSANIHAEIPTLPVPVSGLKVKTNQKDAQLYLHLNMNITPEGELKIKSDPQYHSSVDFLGSHVALNAEMRVSQLESSKPQLEGTASVDASIGESKISVDYGNSAEIGCFVGQDSNYFRASVRLKPHQSVQVSTAGLVDLRLDEQESLRLGALNARFQRAHLHLEGRAELVGKKASVSGGISGVLSHPEFIWRGLHGSVMGQASIEVNAQDLMNGTVEYHLDSDRLPAFYRKLGYRFFPDMRLALDSYNTGVSEFLDPVNQFVWDPAGLMDPKIPPVGELGNPEWRKHIEQITGTPIRKNNRTILLIDGKTSFPKRLELIKNAKKTICVQSLIFKDDESGMAIAEALVEAHKRGVKVRVIVDSLGNLDSVKELIRGNKVYEYLCDNGVCLELYSNLAVKGFRQLLSIVDGHRALAGLNSLKDFVDPKQTLSTLHMFSKVAHGSLNLGLTQAEQEKVHESLRMILGNDSEAEAMIERLANMEPEKPLELSEIVEMLSRVLSLNHRWHEKYMIADGEKAVLGGMNIANEYLRGGLLETVIVAGKERPAWRDTDIFIEGEGAFDALRHFAINWKAVNGEILDLNSVPVFEIEDGVELQVVQSCPERGQSHTITNFKIEAIKCLKAGDKLYEATAYFMPIGALKPYVEALKLAVARGVDVRIVTNSIESTDMPQVNQAGIVSCYRDLLKAGVRLFERTGTRTMHQKTAAYGSRLGMIGSYNLDNRAASLNSEDLVVLHDVQKAQEIEKMLLKDMEPDVAKEKKLEDFEAFEPLVELEHSAWAMMGNLM